MTSFIYALLLSNASSPIAGTPPSSGTPPGSGTPPSSGVPPAAVPSTVDVGILTGTQTFPKQVVGASDNPSDLYRFTLSQIGSFNATVSNVVGNASMKLYFDSNANGVADSTESFLTGSGSNGASSPVSASALPTGNYILEVKSGGFKDSAGYDLILSTTQNPGNISPDAGSEAPTAFFLGSLPNTLVAKDYVGALDKLDVYRFTVNSNVTANINVGGISEGRATVTLYKDINANNLLDSGERVTQKNFFSGEVAQAISSPLATGTYFLSVEPGYFDNTAYTLTIQGS